MTQETARDLIARAMRRPEQIGLARWEENALRLKAAGARDSLIGAAIGRHPRHVEAGLLAARDKVMRADRAGHRAAIPLAANKRVPEPLRGVVIDARHPNPDDPEHFLPILLPLGAGDVFRPPLVDAGDLAAPLEAAFHTVGL